MRGDLVPASRLPSTTVVELVQRRCEARASRNYAAADALKERLEAGGVKLQDCLGGGTTWEYSVSRRDGGGASPMTALARTALESHTDRAAVSRLSDEALALCAAGARRWCGARRNDWRMHARARRVHMRTRDETPNQLVKSWNVEKYAFSKEKVNQHDVAVTVSSFWQAVHKSMTVQKPHLLMKPHQLS